MEEHHNALSDATCRRRADRFKSSLGHKFSGRSDQAECLLTRCFTSTPFGQVWTPVPTLGVSCPTCAHDTPCVGYLRVTGSDLACPKTGGSVAFGVCRLGPSMVSRRGLGKRVFADRDLEAAQRPVPGAVSRSRPEPACGPCNVRGPDALLDGVKAFKSFLSAVYDGWT